MTEVKVKTPDAWFENTEVTVFKFYKDAGGGHPLFFDKLDAGAHVVELYHSSSSARRHACCVGYSWYSFFVFPDGTVRVFPRPGGQALPMKLQPV